MTKDLTKKMMMLVFIIILIASCKNLSREAVALDNDLEPIYGFDFSPIKVSFKVKSHGCTRAEDFIVILDTHEKFEGLSILRTKKDLCRRMPKIIELELPITSLNVEPDSKIYLKNPFVANSR